MSFRVGGEDDEIISQLKSVNATLLKQNNLLKANLQAQTESLEEKLNQAIKKIQWYEEQIKLGKHRQFAKQSETSQTLSLFDDNESDEVTEKITPIDDETGQVNYSRKKKKKGSARNIDTSKLPAERILHDLSDEEKVCSCGCQMQKIGEDISEKIDYIPAQLKVIVHVTPKYACHACETIKAAQRPEYPLQKSMATTNLIVDVILKKYDAHLPLYRQSKLLERDGIHIPDNTLGNWVMGTADALSPLAEAFWEQVALSNYIQADETRVKILYPDKTGYIWAYQGLDPKNRFVVFEFDLTRAASVPEKRLARFSGWLQTDGYSGYSHIGHRQNVTHLGCWDHARRKFTDAVKANPDNKTGIAVQCLALINKLYMIERTIKQASDEIRYQARQEKAKPVLDSLFSLVRRINALPKSTLGTAITYLKNNELQLCQYVDYGHTHISNCLTENSIRPFAIGRRNWLFVGNEDSANKSALLYSLIQSCKINKINVRQYFTCILNKVHAMRRGDIEPTTLLPQFIDFQILTA